MGLGALDAALAGLCISQQQLSVISNNVATGTPGFTRKLLPQSSQAIDGVTVGVAAETIVRNVDINLAGTFGRKLVRWGSLISNSSI